jgi:hypothetical protein
MFLKFGWYYHARTEARNDENLVVRTVQSRVSDETPDQLPVAGVVEALSVRRNAKAGVVVGVCLGVLVYLARVFELLGPFSGTREYPVFGPEGYFLVLAFVLASTTALLVATLLTVVSAYRLTKQL